MAALDQLTAKETPALFWLQGFDGVNLHDSRRAIGDQECSWLENFAPLGAGNARAMYDALAPLYTASGVTIVFDFVFNITTTFYHALFFSDGSAKQVAIVGGAVTTIAPAGTFAVTPTLPDCVQWGASGIVIVTANADGLFAWDGTLYKPGDAAPSWLSGLANPIVVTGNTNTSTSLTNISSTTDVVNGMMVTDAQGDIPAHTLVVSHTSNSAVISQAATGSHAGQNLTFNWMMPYGINGTAVEAFVQRLWVVNGAQFSFSAPGNGADFSTSNGGGTTKSSDGFLRTRFVNLKQSNGFLYLFGDSSINVISNVQTSGSPATTTFNNQNIDQQTGLGWRDSLISFGRALLFANPTGAYALFGGAAQKISDKVDKLFEKADFDAVPPVGFIVDLFNVQCAGWVLNTLDPTTDTQRTIMVLWNGAKWFIGSQAITATFVTTAESGGTHTHHAWGNDGTNLRHLFETASDTLAKKVQTKLWQGQSQLIRKTTQDVYVESADYGGTGVVLTGTLDSDTNASVAFSITANLYWLNNSGGLITFVNNSSQPIQFVSSPPGVQGTQANQAGMRLGITLTSTSPDFALIGMGETYNSNVFYGR